MLTPVRAALRWLALFLLLLPALGHAQTSPPASSEPHPEVLALIRKGYEAENAYQWNEALSIYGEALTKARALQDKFGEASILFNIGTVNSSIGQPVKALPSFELALPIFRQLRDKKNEAGTLTSIGIIHANTGQLDKALQCYEEALPLYRELGEKRDQAVTLANIGVVYSARSQWKKALECNDQALLLYREVRDRGGEAATLTNIGIIWGYMSQPEKALQYLKQALPLHRDTKNKHFEANTLNSMGIIYLSTGQPQKAMQCYEQGRRLFIEIGNTWGQAGTLTSIGAVYGNNGQLHRAVDHYKQALSLYKQISDRRGEAETLNSLGLATRAMDQPQQAIDYFQQALSLHRHLNDNRGEIEVLSNLASPYSDMGQPEQGMASLKQAQLLNRQIRDRSREAIILSQIGAIYVATGQPQRALRSFEQALPIHRAVRNISSETITLSNIGAAYLDMGQIEKALQYYELGLNRRESYRQQIGGDTEGKLHFLESLLPRYHRFISLLLRQQKPDEAKAFLWTQKVKARALLDQMQENKIDLFAGLPREEKEKERSLRLTVQQIQKDMLRTILNKAPAARQQEAELRQQLVKAEEAWLDFHNQLYRRHTDLADLSGARTVTLSEAASFLPSDTALLEYVTLRVDFRKHPVDETLLFVVTKEGGKPAHKVYRLPCKRADLSERADDLKRACSNKSLLYQSKAKELYKLLLAPAEKQLAGKKCLLICPDGLLWGLPFQALRDTNGKHLLERFEIAYAYSASGVRAAFQAQKSPHRPKPVATILACTLSEFDKDTRFDATNPLADSGEGGRPFDTPSRSLYLYERRGVPNLPNTRQEALAIASLFPDAVVKSQDEAQEARIKEEMGKYRYIHFATHGFVNDTSPLASLLILAEPPKDSEEDGLLTAREIFDLKLSAEMVVLSACETAKGKERPGEGVQGLTWALFAAGVPTSIVSQWQVNDKATADLMTAFYQNLKNKQRKGEALRNAALTLMKNPQMKHPYYWAPFVLMGDWK